jgi:ubiquinone/menaquinone biosynthesis C-methylase UbiE
MQPKMFDVSEERYDRFMGRYSRLLAPEMAQFAGITGGMQVADIGCGTGVLSTALAEVVGEQNVAAIDPMQRFVDACRSRVPSADVRLGHAEALPWADGEFDAAIAQLVVAFMDDPHAGVTEMRRIVRPGGTVAFAMWDAEQMQMTNVFWLAARDAGVSAAITPLAYRNEPDLRELAAQSGLEQIHTDQIRVSSAYADFDDFWEPFGFGIGPIGAMHEQLSDDGRAAVREHAREHLGDPAGQFELSALAWAVRGVTPA